MSSRTLARIWAGAVACALSSATGNAHAEAPAITPPSLVHFVPASDPRSDALAENEARVELEIDVGKDGKPSDVRVITSSGDAATDEAARTAALAFEFEPARRAETALAARIRYDYVFVARAPAPKPEAPAVAPVPAPPPPPAVVPAAKAGAEPAAGDSFEATARVEAPPREVTKHSLDAEETKRIAGTRGDPLRAIELMPGVSRPGPDGMPILRGANPADSQVFVEGAPAPGLYHLGGLASIVHSRVLGSVELYPSNFSTRFGRKAGGVVDVRLRDPRTDKLHGILDLSLLDSSLLIESPIGDKWAVLGAVRRSNIDAVLNAAANSADLSITSAPVYWDYQTMTVFRPTARDRFRLMVYGSSDSIAILLKKPADVDPAVRGSMDSTSVFHRVQLGYEHRWDGGSSISGALTYGRTMFEGSFGAIARGKQDTDTLQGRGEWNAVLSPRVRFTAGLDLLSNRTSGSYSGIAPTTGEGDVPTPISSQRRFELEPTNIWIHQPGAYVEAGLRPVPALLLVPGFRADYTSAVKRASLDPRLSARWELTDKTAIKAGIGSFTQAPADYSAFPDVGNPNLRLTKSLHTSAGVEQQIVPGVTASLEGFAKWLDDVVANAPDGRAPRFTNDQSGRIFGGEAMLRVRPRGRLFGFLSYTLMRSERRDDGQPWRLFDRDQPHIVAAAASYRIGRGWEVGASFRYTSGTPYTPVVANSYDTDNDVYRPRLGPAMSARNPAFTRLDLRVEKKWTFKLWSLAMYLDVQNVLNSPNREGFSYSYDYSRRQGVAGLPIFPSLGLRGEL